MLGNGGNTRPDKMEMVGFVMFPLGNNGHANSFDQHFRIEANSLLRCRNSNSWGLLSMSLKASMQTLLLAVDC